MELKFGDIQETALIPLAIKASMKFVSETSYNQEMKKYSVRGKLFALLGKNINNRLAIFRW